MKYVRNRKFSRKKKYEEILINEKLIEIKEIFRVRVRDLPGRVDVLLRPKIWHMLVAAKQCPTDTCASLTTLLLRHNSCLFSYLSSFEFLE